MDRQAGLVRSHSTKVAREIGVVGQYVHRYRKYLVIMANSIAMTQNGRTPHRTSDGKEPVELRPKL
jgi:hypothetical protein